MATTGEARTRAARPPARARRTTEIRRANYEEHAASGHMYDAWLGGDTDLELEAGAEWGVQRLVSGYERIHLSLHVDFGDVGNDMTKAFIVAQGSAVGGADASHWFDLHTEESGDGVLTRKLWEVALVTGANGMTRIAWTDQKRAMRYMRFKVFVNGTTFTDSRATLRGSRVMDAS